jgi:hypothetical protein
MDNQMEEKKEIPTPPPSRVNVRTMQSDMQSIQESGGQNPQPYTTEINQPKKETPAPQEVSFQPSEVGSNIPGYVGPEEPIFKPGGAVGPLPPEQKPSQPEAVVKPPQKGSKILIISLVAVILVAAVLGIGYYFSQKQKSASVTTPEQTTVVTDNTPVPPKPQYFSLFKTANVPQAEETITTLDIDNLKNILNAAATTIPTDTLKEIVLRNADNSLVSSYKIISILLPELGAEDLPGIFEENFMAIVFADKNGAWPAYVFQLKSTADPTQAQTLIKDKLEPSANLKNIFLQEAGRPAAAFKDGQAGDPSVKTRYLTFSNPLAALNYGWVDNKLVIASNYPTLLEVLRNLQTSL